MRKILLLSFLFLGYFSFGQTIPENKGYVSDYENIFTPEQNQELTKLLSDYENETSIEIAILTVPDFESDIADFAQKTATEWGIGKKDINNGLLIVISKNKGVLRSQTGYGLEGYLPDGWLKHTGDSIVYKYFAFNNYYDGLTTFINQCKERIGNEGYSEEHNKELINQNNSNVEKSLFEELYEILPWWAWILIFALWIVWFIISPDTALWFIFFLFSKGNSSSGGGKGFGGGKFGGGGSSSRW